MQEMQVQSLGPEDPLEKKIAIHSSILAWEIPWTEEPGGLQSIGLHRVRHDLGLNNSAFKSSLNSGAILKKSNKFYCSCINKVSFFFFFLIFKLLLLFYFTILYWFCHTSTCIRHGCTHVPHPEPPSHFPPHTIPLGHPSAPAPSILYPASNLDWQFVSYMILYMF